MLSTRHGPVNIIGAPSASAPEQGKYDAAAWYFYRIKRQDGAWQTEVTMRGWDVHAKAFVERQTFAFWHDPQALQDCSGKIVLQNNDLETG